SSRRRHTRSKRDWSSDVCSSDLDRDSFFAQTLEQPEQQGGLFFGKGSSRLVQDKNARLEGNDFGDVDKLLLCQGQQTNAGAHVEIGRASCRERGERAVGGGARST